VARTVPAAPGAWVVDPGADTAAARAIQRSAAAAHASQSEALPQMKRRLDSLDGREHLWWLVPQDGSTPSKPLAAAHAPVTGLTGQPGGSRDEA
jgi:hypothetical protein